MTYEHKIVIYATHVKYLQAFFSFFQNFDFSGRYVVGVEGGEIRGQKNSPNDKKICLLHSISQEQYIIIHHMTIIYDTHL